jgi:hypothetical protein
LSLKSQLQPGEEVLYRAYPSRIVLLPPLLVAIAAGFVFLAVWQHGNDSGSAGSTAGAEGAGALAAGVVALAALLFAGVRELALRTREYVLTDRRLMRQTGILGKISMDSYLDKINNVEHRQDLWGRLFRYGDLEIDTASETGAEIFPRIGRPLAFKRAIDAAVYAYHRGIAVPAGTASRSAVGGPAPGPAPTSPSPPAAPPAATERMRQLKALLDEGLISQSEFESKRKKLLEEM